MVTGSMCPITYQTWRLSSTTQHKILGFGMLFIVENNNYTLIRGLDCQYFVNNPSQASFDPQKFSCFFLNDILKTYCPQKTIV